MLASIFTPRLAQVLYTIGQRDSYTSTQELSESLRVSKRTISREIEGINPFLESFHIQLESRPGKGLRLVGDKHSIDEFLNTLMKELKPFSMLDITQRRLVLISEILKYKEIPKLSYFSNKFEVSEGTISRDISELAGWFETYNLVLQRKSGVGLILHGTEEDFRRATLDFVHERLKEDGLTRYLDGSMEFDEYVYFQSLDDNSIFNLLNKDIL